MIATLINLVAAEINEGKDRKEYISIENENGVLLVTEDLFVISFDNKEDIPYYEHIATLANIKDKEIRIKYPPYITQTK